MTSVAEVGGPVPGFPGLFFEDMGVHPGIEGVFGNISSARPTMDAAGNVGFHAYIGDDGEVTSAFDRSGLFRLRAGVLEPLVVQGDAAPIGTTWNLFPSIFPASPFLEDGQATFNATILDAGGQSVWTERGGSPALVVRDGVNLPGMAPGAALQNVGGAAVGGLIVVQGDIANSGTGDRFPRGVWLERGGALEVLVASGMPAPGFDNGTVFSEGFNLQTFGPLFSRTNTESGLAAFSGWVSGPGIDGLNEEGIWVDRGLGLELFVREGDAVPAGSGFPPGARFGTGTPSVGTFTGAGMAGVRFNEQGDLLFSGRVQSGSDPVFTALWLLRAGATTPELVAKAAVLAAEPTPAPGVAGFAFLQFEFADINDRGDVLLRSQIQGPDRDGSGLLDSEQGVWIERGAGLELVAVSGGIVPGVVGAVFEAIGTTILQDDGRVVYSGTFFDNGLQTGLFRSDVDGSVGLVLRTGEAVRIDDAGLRILSRLIIGRGNAADGRRAMELEFTDGSSGIYVLGVFDAGDSVCACERTGDAAVDVMDLLGFLSVWFEESGGAPAGGAGSGADFDGNGVVGVNDLLAFLGCWFEASAGGSCP